MKDWEHLNNCIDPTGWSYAKQLVPNMESLSANSQKFEDGGEKICTTFNQFRKQGCHFEHRNPDKSCKYVHQCSICSGGHKAWQCTYEDTRDSQYNSHPLQNSDYSENSDYSGNSD